MTQQKKKQIIAGALMTTGMAFALSGFFTIKNLGLSPEMPKIWFFNFLMGWPVGFIVSAIIGARVQRLASKITGEPLVIERTK